MSCLRVRHSEYLYFTVVVNNLSQIINITTLSIISTNSIIFPLSIFASLSYHSSCLNRQKSFHLHPSTLSSTYTQNVSPIRIIQTSFSPLLQACGHKQWGLSRANQKHHHLALRSCFLSSTRMGDLYSLCSFCNGSTWQDPLLPGSAAFCRTSLDNPRTSKLRISWCRFWVYQGCNWVLSSFVAANLAKFPRQWANSFGYVTIYSNSISAHTNIGLQVWHQIGSREPRPPSHKSIRKRKKVSNQCNNQYENL